MPAFTPGMRLHDRYLLEQRIGSGGMAQVWRAHDLVLGRQVAVKTLLGSGAFKAEARREAQAAAKLTHPHITAVHDYAEHEVDGKLVPYLVMELLQGETLADRIARGPLPWPHAAQLGAQIASALAAAHAQGVVHQDVKPANIMLTPSGVKVLDFGIAAMTGHRETSGWIVGTPAYAPPERLRQAPPAPSADVWGLATLLCEMLTGQRAFPLDDWEMAARHRFEAPTLPPFVRDPALSAIRAALDANPQRRPSASALGRALETTPAPTLITPAGSISASASVPTYHAAPAPASEVSPPRSRRGPSPGLIAGAAFAVLVIFIGAIVLLSGVLRPDGGSIQAQPTQGSPTPPVTVSSPALPSNVPALLATFHQAVETGIANGQVERDKVRELRSRVQELQKEWQQQGKKGNNFTDKVRSVQEKVAELAEEGDIKPELATTLDAILAQLLIAGR